MYAAETIEYLGCMRAGYNEVSVYIDIDIFNSDPDALSLCSMMRKMIV